MTDDAPKAPAAPLSDRERRELFGTIYREQFEHVFRTLRRLGVPERDIEDAIHEVFIVVHRRLVDFDVARSARPWVTGIAYRVASDDRRRAHRRRETPSDELEGSSTLDGGDAGGFGNVRLATDEALDAARDRKRVQDALTLLPMDQRVVLVMHDLDGFAMPEIAAELGIPLNTAYSRLRLARNKFETAIRSQQTPRPAAPSLSAGRDGVDAPQDGGPARTSTRKTHGS
ncbi:MAG: sigma-70 family RNA polymerase sigma factor [Myxococcales bacterium]|nr:sigma-70 family RNA polymerase sigma factor [Myxococcales bacterium]